MPTTIVNYNKEIINFLEDVNYGMSKPQFNHLVTMIADSIHIDGKKSISKIAENITHAKDSSCIYRFLGKSPWNDKLLNRNRINLIKFHLEYNIKPTLVGFLVIDDTTNVSGIKPNRTFSPLGIKIKISKFIDYIDPNILDVVTVKDKKYRVYR